MAQVKRGPAGKILEFALIFLLVFLLTQMGFKYLFPGKDTSFVGIRLEAIDATVKGGHHPMLRLINQTEQTLTLPDTCPMPPVIVRKVDVASTKTDLKTTETTLPCVPLTSVAPGATVTIDLAPWKYSLFSELTNYEVELSLPKDFVLPPPVQGAETSVTIAHFSINEAGAITQMFRAFITKPFLNFLIFIASLLPDHDLGIAIIILTIVVKLLLFIPTQHAMQGQRKMQAVQPKIDALREKHKGDPKKLQEETMRLWKEYGVNPMQSCLPTLIQFPILIGLFYTIRDGSILALSRHLIYAPYQHLTWTFNMHFLGLDLAIPNLYVMPILLVLLQFIQMKLTFSMAKKKAQGKEPPSSQQTQQQVMLYGLPLMIGFFAIKFPAAVSVYWGISTIFGIGQQWWVNRATPRS